MIQAKLKLEIIAGYLVWFSFFIAIIYIIYQERRNKSAMEQQETHWQGKRRETNRAFLHLLDLATTGELIAGWTEEDYAAYHEKRIATVRQLQALAPLQEDAAQRASIDSVCNLLVEKERLMSALLSTLEDMPDVEEIVHRKIPAHLPKSREETTTQPVQRNDEPAEPATPKKKKSFWDFLSRKKEKSVYALQREKAQTNTTTPPKQTNASASRPTALLYSLEKEIADTTRIYEERLSAKVDSLRLHNRRLNERINLLVQNFERNEEKNFCREIGMQQSIRDRSFTLITGIGIGAFMLVILLYIIIHRDVNRGYKIRLALEAANKENEELIAARKNMMLSVSHDLRSPLSAISGYAELLPGETDAEKRSRYSAAIRGASCRMLSLLNSLLKFYRLDTGKEQPNAVHFLLNSVAVALENEFAPLAMKKGLAFSVDSPAGNIVVTGDKERLLQIGGNLLSNAVKFTRRGNIRLGLEHRNNELTLEVSDTGTGMSPEQTVQIFEAFRRLDNAGGEEGFGLGLAITRALADLLGGTIEVKSQPGVGSTFTARLPLPLANEVQQPAMEEETPDSLPPDLRVLAIDDDVLLLAMTQDMLSHHGVYCDTCLDVQELTDRLRERPYDLLLSDIQMKETDGYQLMELLRTIRIGNSKEIPILAMTAHTERSEADFREAGFAGCLYKPFSSAELCTAIGQCIGEEKKRPLGQADFSRLLSGERNGKEMLRLFIDETKKEMEAFSQAAEDGNRQELSAQVHHLLPLWKILQSDSSLRELRHLLRLASGATDEDLRQSVHTVVLTGETLIRQAETLITETGDE